MTLCKIHLQLGKLKNTCLFSHSTFEANLILECYTVQLFDISEETNNFYSKIRDNMTWENGKQQYVILN